jgi:hypothetical protein
MINNLYKGDKVLINLDVFIIVPNGKSYSAIFGTVNDNFKDYVSIGLIHKFNIEYNSMILSVVTDKLINTETPDSIFNADEEE